MEFSWTTVLAAIACLIAAFSVGVRGIILSPGTDTWPEGPRAIRAVMFVLAAVLTWTGMTFLMKPDSHHVDWMLLVAALVHAAYQAIMLVNIVRQNYPARFWRAMKRIQRYASCPPEATGPFGTPWFSYALSDHLKPPRGV